MSPPPYEFIATADGTALAARFFAPPAETEAAVLIVSAMGAPQGYYRPFAQWLAAQGYLVATFDYRGTGRSRPATLRGYDADIIAWAERDCAAMIEAVTARAPGKKLIWIGHSLGGQIVPMVPNRERIAKIVTVATGSGYWREYAPKIRPFGWWLWFVAVPLATRAFGYFPGRRLKKVGDLPKGVVEQWRRWCMHRDYAAGAEGEGMRARYAAVTTPIVSLSFVDDEYMSLANTNALHGLYTGAPQRLKRIAPGDIGQKRIGHFGFFRAQQEQALWRPHLLPELAG
jgi:predicted alpha/beta hydrolase